MFDEYIFEGSKRQVSLEGKRNLFLFVFFSFLFASLLFRLQGDAICRLLRLILVSVLLRKKKCHRISSIRSRKRFCFLFFSLNYDSLIGKNKKRLCAAFVTKSLVRTWLPVSSSGSASFAQRAR